VGTQGGDLARMALLDAGFDVKASGVTLDRFCGSGITTTNMAAASVIATAWAWSGEASGVLSPMPSTTRGRQRRNTFASATRTSTDFVPLVGSATIDGTTMTCDLPLVPNDIFRTADGTVCTVEQVTSSNTFEISGATKTTGTLDIAEILVDDFKSIDFNAILAAAVASIKSLTKRVAALEAASKL
jgi:hypothetical protein